MDNLKGIIFQGCPQWSFQFMQGFLSSGTLGFYCTKNKFDPEFKRYTLAAPLIAQLGKNYYNGYNKLISGDELLKMACDKVSESQRIIGGKIVYLECEDKVKLIEFYSSNGFVAFGKRKLDRDETEVMQGEYLIQMLKYLK